MRGVCLGSLNNRSIVNVKSLELKGWVVISSYFWVYVVEDLERGLFTSSNSPDKYDFPFKNGDEP